MVGGSVGHDDVHRDVSRRLRNFGHHLEIVDDRDAGRPREGGEQVAAAIERHGLGDRVQMMGFRYPPEPWIAGLTEYLSLGELP